MKWYQRWTKWCDQGIFLFFCYYFKFWQFCFTCEAHFMVTCQLFEIVMVYYLCLRLIQYRIGSHINISCFIQFVQPQNNQINSLYMYMVFHSGVYNFKLKQQLRKEFQWMMAHGYMVNSFQTKCQRSTHPFFQEYGFKLKP